MKLLRPVLLTMMTMSCASSGGSSSSADVATGDVAASEDVFGPLDVGADYETTFYKVNKEPFISEDHGGRWVNTYVNDIGKSTFFVEEGVFPVGSVLIKESFEDDAGKPSAQRGPIFVMEKRSAGYNTAQNDWWVAIHWAEPVGPLAKSIKEPIYWRGKSPKVAYCNACHENWEEHDYIAVGIPETNLARP